MWVAILCWGISGSPPFGWGAADLGAEMSLGSLPLASDHRIGLTLMQSFRTPSCALENTPEAYGNRTWVQPASAFPACVLGGHLAPSGLTFLLCKMGALGTRCIAPRTERCTK